MYHTRENEFELSENAMQAAGRLSSHTYADLRSARRAYQRTRKYPQERLNNTSDCRCCSEMHYSKARRTRKKDIQDPMCPEVWGDVFACEQQTNEDYSHIDDVDYFEMFGRWRPGVQNAEDFGAWGRRRIMEMRAVKEDRIRRATSNLAPPHSPTTTLPTTSSDIYHHALLTEVLTPTKYLLFKSRWTNISPIPIIYGFLWFGEFEWAWHRNASGCWEFGGVCSDYTLPCPCCCMGNGSMYYSCSCEEFEGTTAPEDVHRCSLVEWVDGELRGIMLEEETAKNEERWVRQEWDVVSDAASEEWSVVSEESESFDEL
jgi:hypothetical protein